MIVTSVMSAGRLMGVTGGWASLAAVSREYVLGPIQIPRYAHGA